MASNILSNSAVKGLTRIGDILIPGDGEFPSFSEYKCMEHIDDLLPYAPSDDISDLGMVLGILSVFPKSILIWLVKKMEKAHQNHGPLGTLLRQLNLGLRGLVFSLYYSDKPGANYKGKHPNELIGFTLNKVM